MTPHDNAVTGAATTILPARPSAEAHAMRDIATGELVAQGAPDAKARFFFDGLQPLSHPERYRSLPIHFIVGELDTHVPPEAAYRFQAAVNGGATSGEITVTELPGLKHLDFVGPVWFQHLAFGSRTRPAR